MVTQRERPRSRGAARNWLASAGYDPVYGTRPLKRTNRTAPQNGVADAILRGLVKDGDTVAVTVGEGRSTLAMEDKAEAA